MTDHKTGTRWLDRAPKGRNETDYWWRHHDAYGKGWEQMIVANGARIMTQPTLPANDRERAPSRAIGAGTLSRQASR